MRSKVSRALRAEARATAVASMGRAHYQALKDAAKRSGQNPKFAKERKRKPATVFMVAAVDCKGKPHTVPHSMVTGGRNLANERRIWRDGEPLIVIKPIRAIAINVDIDVINKRKLISGIHSGTAKALLDWLAAGGT